MAVLRAEDITLEQRQVLRMFARGNDEGWIAEKLHMPYQTVSDIVVKLARGETDRAQQVVALFDAKPTPNAKPAPPAAPAPAPASLPALSAPPGVPAPATRSILERGAASLNGRTRALAEKVHRLLADLNTRVQAEEAERLAAAAREQQQREAERLVADLERQLADAQAKLRAAGGGKRSATPQRDYTPKEVRAWAARKGVECPQFGKVPERIVAAFRAARAETTDGDDQA